LFPNFARGSTPISLQGSADGRRNRRGFRMASSRLRYRRAARVETGVLDFIAGQMELLYDHGRYWCLKRTFPDCAPETVGYQLPYAPRELYRNVIREVNAGRSKTLQRLDLPRI